MKSIKDLFKDKNCIFCKHALLESIVTNCECGITKEPKNPMEDTCGDYAVHEILDEPQPKGYKGYAKIKDAQDPIPIATPADINTLSNIIGAHSITYICPNCRHKNVLLAETALKTIIGADKKGIKESYCPNYEEKISLNILN